MRTTVVPAQITTVEDKVAGNLSLVQLVLMTMPVFVGGLLYVVLPPGYANAPYKTILITIMVCMCILSAVRFKGRIILSWIILIGRYNRRPKYHTADKNDMYMREPLIMGAERKIVADVAVATVKMRSIETVTDAERVMLEDLMGSPSAALSFVTNRKGALDVRVTEVK